jgi:hypothetical protein
MCNYDLKILTVDPLPDGKILAGKFWSENFGGNVLAGMFWQECFGRNVLVGKF